MTASKAASFARPAKASARCVGCYRLLSRARSGARFVSRVFAFLFGARLATGCCVLVLFFAGLAAVPGSIICARCRSGVGAVVVAEVFDGQPPIRISEVDHRDVAADVLDAVVQRRFRQPCGHQFEP